MALNMNTTVNHPNGLILSKVRLKGSQCCFLLFTMKLLANTTNNYGFQSVLRQLQTEEKH